MDALIPHGAAPCSIAGVWTKTLAVMPGKGGPVLHMLRCDAPHFSIFGEIYFSLIEKGAVKAWKKHQRQSQNFACPGGRIRIVAYDARQSSPTFGNLETFILGLPDNYRLLHIPAGICYGFAALDETPALLANCADMPHSPEEAENIPADSNLVPYSWTRSPK